MGAIQSSINNMLGTAAAGVALGKHAKEQQEAKEIALAGMAEKKAEEEVNLNELEEQQSNVQDELERLNKGQTPDGKGGWNTGNPWGLDIGKEIEKRNLVMSILQEKIKAKMLLINSYKKALGEKTVEDIIGGKNNG